MTTPGEASEVDDLTLELLDRYEEINLLYDIATALAGVFDVETIGRMVVDRAMAVTHADGGVFLLANGASVTVGYRAGLVPGLVLDDLIDGGLLARVRATPLLVLQPLLAARVQRHSEMFAVIGLTGKRDAAAFTAGDGRLLLALAEQAAAAIHTGRLVREVRESERIRSELEIAHRLQQSLLPTVTPMIPGLALTGSCEPAGRVGGDYFDFFSLPAGALGLVIADVSGHGVSSAIVMAGLRATLHAEIREEFAPARVLAVANRVLARDFGDSGMFVSVFLAKYEPDTGVLTYTNAGHPPPLLVDGQAVQRLTRGGLVLGVAADADYESDVASLGPGAMLVLYTDGLTEARWADSTFFSEVALTRIIKAGGRLDAAGLHRTILAAVRDHRSGAAPDDDVTLVVASRTV